MTRYLMAPIWLLAAVACARAYADEPASKESPAVQSTTAPVNTATGNPVPAAPSTPTAATATPAAATSAPVPVDRKKALQFGFRPGVVDGIPVFCKEVPIEGTRFTNKRCVRENQFSAYLTRLQIARDAAVKNGCYGADYCGNVDTMSGKPRMSMGTNR